MTNGALDYMNNNHCVIVSVSGWDINRKAQILNHCLSRYGPQSINWDCRVEYKPNGHDRDYVFEFANVESCFDFALTWDTVND